MWDWRFGGRTISFEEGADLLAKGAYLSLDLSLGSLRASARSPERAGHGVHNAHDLESGSSAKGQGQYSLNTTAKYYASTHQKGSFNILLHSEAMKVHCSVLRSGALPSPPVNRNGRVALPVCRSLREGANPVNAVAAAEEAITVTDELAKAIEASGYDMSISGLATISDEAKVSNRTTTKLIFNYCLLTPLFSQLVSLPSFPVSQLRALAKKANKFEKVKNAKCGSRIWTEVQDLAALIREGQTTWEDLDLDDIDIRLKWAGLFHRRKRTPGKFMMRLKVR